MKLPISYQCNSSTLKTNSCATISAPIIDWGRCCYPLTRAIGWGGEKDLVISPEINQSKRVESISLACLTGLLNKSISPHSVPLPSPGASVCQEICIFHLRDYHWGKDVGRRREKIKLQLESQCCHGNHWREKTLFKTLIFSWCEVDIPSKIKSSNYKKTTFLF